MFVDLLLCSAIFGYAGWTLYRFVKRSQEGACSACSVKDRCQTPCAPDAGHVPPSRSAR